MPRSFFATGKTWNERDGYQVERESADHIEAAIASILYIFPNWEYLLQIQASSSAFVIRVGRGEYGNQKIEKQDQGNNQEDRQIYLAEDWVNNCEIKATKRWAK